MINNSNKLMYKKCVRIFRIPKDIVKWFLESHQNYFYLLLLFI